MRSLLRSDYARLYAGRSEDGAELRRRAWARFLVNPSLHAVVLLRAASISPRALFGAWRLLLRVKHSIDLGADCELGPGLVLPHPFALRLAPGTRVGADVTLYHNVDVGGRSPDSGPPPVIGNGAIVHMNATIAPGTTIGAGAVIGANSAVEGEIPAGAVVRRDGEMRLPGV